MITTTWIPSVYDNSRESLESIKQFIPFNAIILHEQAREFIPIVRQLQPSAMIVYRKFLDPRMHDLLTGNRNLVNQNGKNIAKEVRAECPQADAYIGLCEPSCATHDEAALLAIFDAGFSYILNSDGKIALVGGFASGSPEPEIIEDYVRELLSQRTLLYKNNLVLHFHAYGPNLKLYDAPSDLMQSAASDNALRFILRWRNFPLPYLISECGPSGYVQDSEEYGWKGRYEENTVLEDLLWLLQQSRGSYGRDRLIGISPYCIGNSGGWDGFNLNGTGIPFALGNENRGIGDVSDLKAFVRSFQVFPLLDPPVTSEENSRLINWLHTTWDEYKKYWELVGGLEDNFMTHLLAIGNLSIPDDEWKRFFREKIVRRRDSAIDELANFDRLYSK